MRKIRYHPLICVDDENGDLMPLFSSESKENVEAHHNLYLSEMIPHYYRLNTKYLLAKDALQGFHIHCPICGKSMNPMSLTADENHLPLFCCLDCSRKE